jgi:DNA helicase-2/ATP-dependent DNA helicase PcrA
MAVEIDWRTGLSPDQVAAARHKGRHGRLLAGPGTGKTKTLVHRALALIAEHGVLPSEILVLTFTRVAAYQLRQQLESVLGPIGKGSPYVSTLHSFALRQLVRNASRIHLLPEPFRIADDWEERYIIQEDLKLDLSNHLSTILAEKTRPIDKIRYLFNWLSADWETLRVDLDEGHRFCRDAKFLGAWRQHRETFGYAMRAELVYQLKKALAQNPNFELESGFKHVLVDEYQDLNSCDLAIIDELARMEIELFVAGDDDQSIYGFRYADPVGIRIFPDKYGAEKLDLEICWRCDKSILELGEFVANLDYQRLPKKTRPREDSSEGEVHLQCYSNQDYEASGVAEQCKRLLAQRRDASILVLLRSDHQGRMSKPLMDALAREQVPVVVRTEESLLDTSGGRKVLSLLRLINDPMDSLAWYSMLLLAQGIGVQTQRAVRQLAKDAGCTYSKALGIIHDGASTPGVNRKKLLSEVARIQRLLEQFGGSAEPLRDQVHSVIGALVSDAQQQEQLEEYFRLLIAETDAQSLEGLVQAVSVSLEPAEQEMKQGAVNIMTMHKAKGLSADAVFMVAAERQYIPGKNIGLKAEDERRLLYVSLTRARHLLVVTFCEERTGQQLYTGSESGKASRELTPFLVDSPLKVESFA